MGFVFDQRAAESPLIDSIWRTQSEGGGSFLSSAGTQGEIVVTRQRGEITLTVRGAETKASLAPIPLDADFLGIRFKLGTFMPLLPANLLVDGGINLPLAAGQAFWLNGSAWQFPNLENVDSFVAQLIHDGLLVREPIVDAALRGQLKMNELSLRSVQRRFVQATGLSQRAILQIERAQRATALLEQGISILDVVELTGYADQPHLTRSLKRFIGSTPAQIVARRSAGALS